MNGDRGWGTKTDWTGILTIFFNATEDVVYIVWEEAFCVEHCLNKPCDGAQGHFFVMGMLVPLWVGTDCVNEARVRRSGEETISDEEGNTIG